MKKTLNSLVFLLLALRGMGQSPDSLAAVREVDSLIKVSQILTDKREFERALQLNEAAGKLVLEQLGKETAAYGSYSFNHGRILYFKDDYPEAEKWYLESKAVREKILGKEHPDYAGSLIGLSTLYLRLVQLKKAEPLCPEALAILQKTKMTSHLDYPLSLHNMAWWNQEMGNFEEAIQFYQEAITARERILGKENPDIDLMWSLNNLGNTYWQTGFYEKAEQLHLKVKEVREKILGRENPDYAGSLLNLAALYFVMGDYERAETFLLKGIYIFEVSLSNREHPFYLLSLRNLANLYAIIGNYDKAESLYLEALAVTEKVQGRENGAYAGCLSAIANIHKHKGNYKKAESLILEAMTIEEKSLGKEHPEYAFAMVNLADLYAKEGNFKKSELLYDEAGSIIEKKMGSEHPLYATCMSGLGLLYVRMGAYEKAIPFYHKAKTIIEKSLGNQHPDYLSNLNGLTFSYWHINKFDTARYYLSEAVETGAYLLAKASRHLSEREMSAYLNRFNYLQNQLFSFTQKRSGLVANCYDNTLFYKGFLINAVSQISKLAQTDSATAEKYYLLKSCHRRLAAEYTQPIDRRNNVANLEEEANTIEKELARNIADFGAILRQVNWQDVQAALKPGEATIEFMHYNFVNPGSTDSVMYAALLLRHDATEPAFIPLCEEKQLDSLIHAFGERHVDYVNNLYSLSDRGIVEPDKSTLSLNRLIWQPLEKELSGVTTIYFSPSGLLHRINLAAIPLSADSVLADRYQLVQLGCTRQLVVQKLPPATAPSYAGATAGKTATATLLGGIRYDMDSTVVRQASSIRETNNELALQRGALSFTNYDSTFRSGRWDYLPYTEKEVTALQNILQSVLVPTQVFKGYAATEESFKTIGRGQSSPHILHIATHGFFFPDPVQSDFPNEEEHVNLSSPPGQEGGVFKISGNPMIRSGLLLAGANLAWKTGKPLRPDMEDGILTAYEISQMNLTQTELVVLSACETGLGDIRGNEGVYGLQRAFKIAGAKYLIMSLWEVPDEQTSLLMTTFYEKWLEGKMAIPEAFRAAQKELRDLGFESYQWAGFVLVE